MERITIGKCSLGTVEYIREKNKLPHLVLNDKLTSFENIAAKLVRKELEVMEEDRPIPYGNLCQMLGNAMQFLTDEQIETFCGSEWKEWIQTNYPPCEMESLEE